ncbi:MAG: hypothetical protein FWG94_00140 [Oscillospiraceae bacterium]|nr:hypothetical protein [Oscillospiraceae bacterium]
MKSDIYTGKHGIEAILSEVDRIGRFCKLSPSGTGKLRLLAEEMLGLTVRLFDDLEYEFYIETEEKSFTLNLKAETFVNAKQKERMLSLSSRGENKADEGIFGKISGIFESLLMDDGEYERIYIPYIPNYDMIGMSCYFSLSAYQNDIPKTIKEEQWDGLEKSIIANLAKDIIIGVRNNKVEMIVTIEF